MLPGIESINSGSGVAAGAVLALVLGLRHATEPDHLTAVSTLAFDEATGGMRRCGLLGLVWGAGHGATILALGLPAVLASRHLPDVVHVVAETLVGVVICLLAVRLLLRWRRGAFHFHAHQHGAVTHAHPHAHADGHATGGVPVHEHPHGATFGGSMGRAFGVGLLHGAGGSAAATVLLATVVPDPAAAAVALVVFAAGSALAMGGSSALLGHVLSRPGALPRLERAIPVFAIFGLLFGVWYIAGVAGFGRV